MNRNLEPGDACEDRFAVIDRMRAAFADVSTEEIEVEVARAVAEVRAEKTAKDDDNT